MCWFSPGEGGKRIYGGVQLDGELAKECATGENSFDEQNILRRAIIVTLAIADMPLSAVCDTATAPFLIANGAFIPQSHEHIEPYQEAFRETGGDHK
jgi:uncharacterized protein YceK